MEPNLSSAPPQITPENRGVNVVQSPVIAHDLQPEVAPVQPEQHGPVIPELLVPSTGAASSTPAPITPPPVVPQAVPAQQVQDDPQQNDTSTSPHDADDIDVIEKAWVDRAKEIVHKTKANPFEQEKQVNQLQADYLKKRYGKNIGVVDE